ncbi:uncharacterized protein BDR25DRAFT_204411, partial [Lindgomyces ingoldianus]
DAVTEIPEHVSWYNWWVRQEIEKQPEDIYSVLSEAQTEGNNSWIAIFNAVWRGVWIEAVKPDSSIDTIIANLLALDLLRLKDDTDSRNAKDLIFAIIGWQTMLYRPDTGSCPTNQLAIADETNEHRGQAHLSLQQSRTASRKTLHEFLLGFGVMLPCRNFSALNSEEDRKILTELYSIESASFNAHLLVTVGRISINWTDSLACHLEFNERSNTLYLFRYPSFCGIHCLSQEQRVLKTTIHSCAAPPTADSLHWATSEDVDHLLGEILATYRLLFGQNKASRKLFRTLKPQPFEGLPEEGRDNSLLDICTKSSSHAPNRPSEKDRYILASDFPIHRSRIAILARFLSTKRPRTWKEIWNDKRNSANWFTFWAVLIIGGLGITLAFIQVVLQIIQI